MKTAGRYLEQDRLLVSRALEEFHSRLLQVNGQRQCVRRRHAAAARAAGDRLTALLKRHVGLQENVLFPYVAKFVPKHDSVIRFLACDHAEIMKNAEKICRLLEAPPWPRRLLHDFELQHSALYWICLLRHHLELENASVARAVKEDLNPAEKKEITTLAARWMRRRAPGITKWMIKKSRTT